MANANISDAQSSCQQQNSACEQTLVRPACCDHAMLCRAEHEPLDSRDKLVAIDAWHIAVLLGVKVPENLLRVRMCKHIMLHHACTSYCMQSQLFWSLSLPNRIVSAVNRHLGTCTGALIGSKPTEALIGSKPTDRRAGAPGAEDARLSKRKRAYPNRHVVAVAAHLTIAYCSKLFESRIATLHIPTTRRRHCESTGAVHTQQIHHMNTVYTNRYIHMKYV